MHKRYHKRGGQRTGDGIKNVFEETDMQVQEAQRIPKKINPNRPTPRHIIIKMARFPWCSVGKESACNAGDPSSIPGSGTSPGEGICYPLQYSWASLVGQLVKNLPAMWEAWVQSLGWEDPLEKGMAMHSSTPAWRIPWTEEPGGQQSTGLQTVRHN